MFNLASSNLYKIIKALRIILKCTDEPDFGKCALKELEGKAKECVLNCLGKTLPPVKTIESEEKNRFVDCLKKCLTWQAVIYLK
jgi:hypothetical protein